MRFRFPDLNKRERTLQAKHLFASFSFGIPELFYSDPDASTRWQARQLFVDPSHRAPGTRDRTAEKLADRTNLAFTAILKDIGHIDRVDPHHSLSRFAVQDLRREIKGWLTGDMSRITAAKPTTPKTCRQQKKVAVLHRAGPALSARKGPEPPSPPPDTNTLTLPALLEIRIDPECVLADPARLINDLMGTLKADGPIAQAIIEAARKHAPYAGRLIDDGGISINIIGEALSFSTPVASRKPLVPEDEVRRAVHTHFGRRRFVNLELVAGQWLVVLQDHYGKSLHGRFIARVTPTGSAIGDTNITFDRV